MHTWCEISGERLKQNFLKLRGLAGGSLLACVLKSNAYGHGLEPVFKALAPLEPQVLCLNYLYEAKLLRSLFYEGRILLVGPSLPSELELAYNLNVEVAIGSEELLNAWVKEKKKAFIHLEFDTGLSRQGLFLEKTDIFLLRFFLLIEYLYYLKLKD